VPDVIHCNPNAVTEIELAVMQLSNDCRFLVTAEANQSLERQKRTALCLPLYDDFRVHEWNAVRIENSSRGERFISSQNAYFRQAISIGRHIRKCSVTNGIRKSETMYNVQCTVLATCSYFVR
jgi:hypothetical protein